MLSMAPPPRTLQRNHPGHVPIALLQTFLEVPVEPGSRLVGRKQRRVSECSLILFPTSHPLLGLLGLYPKPVDVGDRCNVEALTSPVNQSSTTVCFFSSPARLHEHPPGVPAAH